MSKYRYRQKAPIVEALTAQHAKVLSRFNPTTLPDWFKNATNSRSITLVSEDSKSFSVVTSAGDILADKNDWIVFYPHTGELDVLPNEVFSNKYVVITKYELTDK